MFYLQYTLAAINVLRSLFDGMMFLTACDDDFILKCE